MKHLGFSFILVVFSCFASTTAGLTSAQELPTLPAITPEDLALKDNPAAAGSPAVILYYAVDTDNTNGTETISVRIKILQDEGRKYADVQIPYYEKQTHVEEIHARTIAPDGTRAEFTDQVYDREIVKARKVRVSAKVLTLPNVQVGSIIEYSYRLRYKEKVPDLFRHPEAYQIKDCYAYPAAEWEIQRDLFVHHGRFTLHAVTGSPIKDFYVALPKNAVTERRADKTVQTVQLDLDDVPAFEQEEYSPPEGNLKIRADMYYAVGFGCPDGYWAGVARRHAEDLDKFIGKSKAIEREETRLVAPGDTDEAKLRKFYGRVQEIRAVSFEGEKTEKEVKQENLKELKNAEDVLSHGYGTANEINLLFIALARAAGFEAQPMLVSSRKVAFFMRGYPNERQLNAMIVSVRTGSTSVYLDPGTRFCPYGLLPWDEADAGGVLVDINVPNLRLTPASRSQDSVLRRDADLKLNTDGALSGRVTVLYFGQEALSMRLDALRQDDVERRKVLEESLKSMLSQGATVRLVKVEAWESTDVPLKAEFEIEVPNFASVAGKRLILPASVFHSRDKNPFSSPRRTHPICFGYSQERYEEVRVELPTGIKVESLPADELDDQGAAYYSFSLQADGNAIKATRSLRISKHFFSVEQYKNLSHFYARVSE